MATVHGSGPLAHKDIRDGFHCGVASLGAWLVEHAPSADAAGAARTYVVLDEVQDRVVGATFLADAMQRTLLVAAEPGVRLLLVHAVDKGARSFYLRFGFDEPTA